MEWLKARSLVAFSCGCGFAEPASSVQDGGDGPRIERGWKKPEVTDGIFYYISHFDVALSP